VHSKRSFLMIGHSHSMCIQAAAKAQSNLTNVCVINLGKITELGMKVTDIAEAAKAEVQDLTPGAVCLSIKGNEHNVLGILENPVPFSIGEKAHGTAPRISQGRHFIPFSLMEDHFSTYGSNLRLIKLLYELFPVATRIYLNPPPPIADFEHIVRNPGIFCDKISLGSSPKELKMQLYRIQTKVLSRIALESNAIFVEPEPELLDAEGFLASPYYNTDPTHGNSAYGKIMLNKMLKLVGQEK